MATKAPALPPLEAHFPNDDKPDEANALAVLALHPSANAAVVIQEFGKTFGDLNLGALVDGVSAGVSAMQSGDLGQAESMLFAQAQALQSIFMNFSRRALRQDYQPNLEAFLRMALKAQNQCRMTLETLANIKNPPVVIARQANINNGGQQQVNNGGVPTGAQGSARARARTCAKNQPERTELLEGGNGEWLDAGAQGSASGADSHLEALGTVHRAKNGGGQDQGVTKRRQRRNVEGRASPAQSAAS